MNINCESIIHNFPRNVTEITYEPFFAENIVDCLSIVRFYAPNLLQVNHDFSLNFSPIYTSKQISAPMLSVVRGKFMCNTNWHISFSMDCVPSLKTVGGDCFCNCPVLSVINGRASHLFHVKGNFLVDCSALKHVADFNHLTFVDGSFGIRTGINDTSAFISLQEVGGNFLCENNNLMAIDVFPKLRTVRGDFVTECPAIHAIMGQFFPCLETTNKFACDNASLRGIFGFISLRKTHDFLVDCTRLSAIANDAFPALVEAGEMLTDCAIKRLMCPFRSLEIASTFMTDCAKLSRIEPIPKLKNCNSFAHIIDSKISFPSMVQR